MGKECVLHWPNLNAIEIVVPNKFVSGLTNLKHFILCQ